ncbi:DapH/DapD/GlmU-related protein [Marinilactibacillus sp. XAAS-LB27]|nr:DapH/DapD/GlmU-related protein [Marinilactibacillus sp. XAAS-LB27]
MSDSRISLGAKKIRSFFARKIIDKVTGKNINIEKGAIFDRTIEIGDNSGIGVDCKLYGKVIIGDNVMMGPEVIIYTSNHNFKDTTIPMNLQGHEEESPVIIGNDVWIGSRVTILPGVNIGDGAVIGTGAIVTKDVSKFSIVAGNPAKQINSRLKK